MNIDRIKWMCGYAEGFKHLINNVIEMGCYNLSILNSSFKIVQYPLLLQRAIEGVNKEYYYSKGKYFVISQFKHGLVVETETTRKEFYLERLDLIITIDQAKESALEYVQDHEGKK